MAKQQKPRMDRPKQQARPRPEGTRQLSRGQQRRRAMHQPRRPWWRGPIPLIGTVVVVCVVIGVFIVVANQASSNSSQNIGQPVPAAILRAVTTVNPSVIAAVGAGTLPGGAPLPNPYRAISGPALTAHGLPQVLYIGAEFCPFCAADRWSLVNALSRFGAFSNLRYMRSAVNDGNIATITFYGSHYSSPYLSFNPIENEDRNQSPLQPLSSEQQHLFATLGSNGYPFVDIAGQYANDAPNSYSGGYDESVLSGKDWTQITGALTNARDPITQGLIGNANYLTAAICRVTHNRPASACATATIQRMEQQFPARH